VVKHKLSVKFCVKRFHVKRYYDILNKVCATNNTEASIWSVTVFVNKLIRSCYHFSNHTNGTNVPDFFEHIDIIITSTKEGGYVFSSVCLFVCLSVCLSVCPSDYSQTCEQILTKFFGGVGHGSRTK